MYATKKKTTPHDRSAVVGQITTNVHVVIGPVKAGKSTFIRTFHRDNVFVRPGFVFREMIGVDRMRKDPRPNACVSTERLTRHLVESGMELALQMETEAVFDGFPRSVEQARWFLDLLASGKYRPEGHVWRILVHVVTADRDTLLQRIHAADITERAFSLVRLDASIETTHEVVNFLKSNWNNVEITYHG